MIAIYANLNCQKHNPKSVNDVDLDSLDSILSSVDWNQVQLCLLYHTRKLLLDLVTNVYNGQMCFV